MHAALGCECNGQRSASNTYQLQALTSRRWQWPPPPRRAPPSATQGVVGQASRSEQVGRWGARRGAAVSWEWNYKSSAQTPW